MKSATPSFSHAVRDLILSACQGNWGPTHPDARLGCQRAPDPLVSLMPEFLSGTQTDTVRRVLAKNRSRFSQYGVSTEAILQEVAMARAKGFSARARALTPGKSAVSVMIRSSSGAAHGALTINLISRRLSPKRTDDIVARLRMHAKAIELEHRKAAASRSARRQGTGTQ